MTTEADVLEAAIDQVQRGFTPNAYFAYSNDSLFNNGPGETVVATCALGGLEQALWKLTGQDAGAGREDRRTLYGRTLTRVNAKARELFPRQLLEWHQNEADAARGTVEELTFGGISDTTGKRRVLRVFRAALEDAKAA